MTDEANNNNPAGKGPTFAILRVYLKDVSFETPNSPAIFLEDWKPEVQLQVEISSHYLEGGVYEVVMHVNVTAAHGDRTGFLVEIQQSGIFSFEGYEDAEKDRMLGAYCPSVLFPFAREVVADLVSKGGFPQLLLGPINFREMYDEKRSRTEITEKMQ